MTEGYAYSTLAGIFLLSCLLGATANAMPVMTVPSGDGTGTLYLPAGCIITQSDGSVIEPPPTLVSIPSESLLLAEDDSPLFLCAYECGPEKISFLPPAALYLTSPVYLNASFAFEDFHAVWWDEERYVWKEVPFIIDSKGSALSIEVLESGTYALTCEPVESLSGKGPLSYTCTSRAKIATPTKRTYEAASRVSGLPVPGMALAALFVSSLLVLVVRRKKGE